VDHYASLGVSRTSEDVVIRAAYLALMRRYHPDGNPSPEAVDRVRAITAAYDVLGDEASRRDYDRGLGLAPERSPPPPRRGRRAGPLAFAATILCLAVLVWLSARSAPGPIRAEAGALAALPRDGEAQRDPLTCLSPEAGALSRQAVLRQANALRQGGRRIVTL
jgi:curved DNA-binding protein CbpA